MNDYTKGGCLCGDVRYVAHGQPSNSMVCHCETCRRTTGAPIVAWVTFATASFSFVHGTPAQFRSSGDVNRTFCPSCGTHLTYAHDQRPQEVDITTCSLELPGTFPPTHHSWLSDSLDWIRLDDSIPKYHRTSGDE